MPNTKAILESKLGELTPEFSEIVDVASRPWLRAFEKRHWPESTQYSVVNETQSTAHSVSIFRNMLCTDYMKEEGFSEWEMEQQAEAYIINLFKNMADQWEVLIRGSFYQHCPERRLKERSLSRNDLRGVFFAMERDCVGLAKVFCLTGTEVYSNEFSDRLNIESVADHKSARYASSTTQKQTPFYSEVETGNGKRLGINPAYVEAGYEDACVFSSLFMDWLVPSSVQDPQNYFGSFTVLENEQGSYVSAYMTSAFMPKQSNFGDIIRHKLPAK